MDAPILLVVDEDPGVLEALSGDLGRRFAADYRILAEPSPASALTAWNTWRARRGEHSPPGRPL
jgi:hypothetical protein